MRAEQLSQLAWFGSDCRKIRHHRSWIMASMIVFTTGPDFLHYGVRNDKFVKQLRKNAKHASFGQGDYRGSIRGRIHVIAPAPV